MAAQPSLDPFVLIRKLVGTLEKKLNDTARPIMGSEDFSRAANQVMSGIAVLRKLLQELSRRYFESLNIPSRADVVALSDKLQDLEDRIIGIQATLDQMQGATRKTALPGPSRTKKPPGTSQATRQPASQPTRQPTR